MKPLLILIIITLTAAAVHAQVVPNQLPRLTPDYKIKGLMTDTCLLRLSPNLPYSGLLSSSLGSLKQFNPTNNLLAASSTEIVYSRMPVVHLQRTDNMPVAGANAGLFNMPLKRVVVVDPLKRDMVQ